MNSVIKKNININNVITILTTLFLSWFLSELIISFNFYLGLFYGIVVVVFLLIILINKKIILCLYIFLVPLIKVFPPSAFPIRGVNLSNLTAIAVIGMSFFALIFLKKKELPVINFSEKLATFFIISIVGADIFDRLIRVINGNFSEQIIIEILKLLLMLFAFIIVIKWIRDINIAIYLKKVMKFSFLFFAISGVIDYYFPNFFQTIFLGVHSVSGSSFFRTSGLFNGHVTQLGSFLVIGEAFFLDEIRRKASFFNFICLAIIFIAMLFTGTRIAFGAGILVLIIYVGLYSKYRIKQVCILISIILVTYLSFGHVIRSRFSSDYQTVHEMLSEKGARPVIFKNYFEKMTETASRFLFGAHEDDLGVKYSTHNTFINLWIRAGIIYVVIFVILLIKIVKYELRRFGLVSGIFLATIGWLLTAFVNENESLSVVGYLILYLAIFESLEIRKTTDLRIRNTQLRKNINLSFFNSD